MMEWNPQKALWLAIVNQLSVGVASHDVIGTLLYCPMSEVFHMKVNEEPLRSWSGCKRRCALFEYADHVVSSRVPSAKAPLVVRALFGQFEKKNWNKESRKGPPPPWGVPPLLVDCWLRGYLPVETRLERCCLFFACLLASTSGYVETRTCETRWTCKFLPARESRNQS